jgi:cytochrome c oxidase subunit 4
MSEHGAVHASDHIVPVKIYVAIFLTLLVLTFVTVQVAYVDLDRILPHLNIVVALAIAVFKAVLVILFFMHVKYSPRLTWLVVGASFVWLGIMVAITLADYLTRGALGTPGS